jgi:hypothetical protein
VIFVGVFTFSTVLTFFSSSYSTMLSGLSFPPREMEILGGLPLQGYHFALLMGPPLLVTWWLAVLSRRYFAAAARP